MTNETHSTPMEIAKESNPEDNQSPLPRKKGLAFPLNMQGYSKLERRIVMDWIEAEEQALVETPKQGRYRWLDSFCNDVIAKVI